MENGTLGWDCGVKVVLDSETVASTFGFSRKRGYVDKFLKVLVVDPETVEHAKTTGNIAGRQLSGSGPSNPTKQELDRHLLQELM